MARLVLGIPFDTVSAEEDERSVTYEGVIPGLEGVDLSAPADLEEARQLDWPQKARQKIRDWMVSAAAGPVAQIRFEGRDPPTDVEEFYLVGGGQDAQWIRGYALGLSALERLDDPATFRRRRELIEAAVSQAWDLVNANWQKVQTLAERLQKLSQLSHEEAARLLRE